MKKLLSVLLIAATACLISSNAKAQEIKYNIPETSTVVEISADAEVKAKPDTAFISAGVETIAKTAEAAFTESSDKMKKIYAALKEAGIEEKELSTSGINLYPFRSYTPETDGKENIDEYKADNTISIKMSKMENIGKVIDVLVSQGCNQMSGPNFTVEKQDELLNQARIDAVKKAQTQAELYASNTGLTVKRIISMEENVKGFYGNRQPMRMLKAEAASFDAGNTPISPEEQSVGVTIRFRYELVKK